MSAPMQIGKVFKRDGKYHVYCAACGCGKATNAKANGLSRAMVIDQLRNVFGWSDKPDKRWRCVLHKRVP